MSIIDTAVRALSFKDTIFLKKSSDLEERLEALKKLNEEYPNNASIEQELYIVKKGLEGEKEIEYQLKKSNLGIYVLHDINLEYEDMSAQIDYIIFTKFSCYFIECKNLVGDIIIDNKGNFRRKFKYKNKIVEKGIYSPLRQVEEHREVYKKIRDQKLSWFKKVIAEKQFTNWYKVLVVAANKETIIDDRYAPKNIKDKVIRADALVRRIQSDLDASDATLWDNQKGTEEWANIFLKMHVERFVDYYREYKEKFITNDKKTDVNNDLREKLINFRKIRSKEMNIPAYYVFTNEELDKIVEIKPTTIEELKNILPSIKIKTHGEYIIKEIKSSI